ncbi:hypothetical protein M3E13_14660, partial [Oceanobacillus kimchii]|nr:hypothetical protein [Oceanobacillus kimchii]
MQRKKWIFDVVERRNVTQGNEAGLQPVFFSPDFQTIKTQHFVDSDVNYKNVGYVGGQGEGVERKIVKVGDSKGFDLHETFIDARDIGEGSGENEEELTEEEIEQLLIDRGQQKMREFETTFYLEAQILTPTINNNSGRFTMRTPFEYEKDFRLGDTVEVFNKRWNITMDAPITEFKEIHEANGFVLEAVFGEAQPTLIKKINDKFNELLGVDKQELPAKISVEKMKEAIDFADERISEEERKRMEEAHENLQESKQWADEKSYQAEQEAKRHADDQDTFYDEIAKEDAKNKADEAEDNSKYYADEKDKIVEDNAKQDASDKAKEAEDKANDYTDNSMQVVNEALNIARDEIASAIIRIDESEQIIQEAKSEVDNAVIRLDDFEIDLNNKIDQGAAVEDINDSNSRIFGKNILLDGDALIRGSLGASEATFLDLTTRDMTAINAIIQDSTITGTLNANNAVFKEGIFDDARIVNANIQNAVITGRLEGVTGNYAGKLSSLIREDTVWNEDDYFVAEIDRGSVRTLSWERDPNFPLAISSYLGGSLQFIAHNNSANFNPNNLNDPNINNASFTTKIVNYTTDGMRVRKIDPSKYNGEWFINNEGYLHIEDDRTNLFSRKRLQLFSDEGVYIYQGTSSQGNIYIGTGVWTSDRVHIAGGTIFNSSGVQGNLNVSSRLIAGYSTITNDLTVNGKITTSVADIDTIINSLDINGTLRTTNKVQAEGGIQVGGGSGQYVHTNAVQNDVVGTNLYLRTFSGGEVRATVNDGTTDYVDMKANNFIGGGRDTLFRSDNYSAILESNNDWVFVKAGRELRVTRQDTNNSYIRVLASDFIPSSSEKWKSQIEVYNGSALELLNVSTIYQYYKEDSEDLEYGFITERETPNEIIRGEGISSYSTIGLAVKAIQELSDELTSVKYENMLLNKRVEELEKGVA